MSPCLRVSLSPYLLVSLSLALLSPAFAQKQKLPTPPRIGEITIEKFQDLLYQPETNYFKSPGPVTITIIDADTGEKTVLTADDAEGQPNGDIIVKGKLRLQRTEGYLTGRGLTYHGADVTGEIFEAESKVANTTLRGKKIEMLRDEKGRQVLRATGAYFTTCIEQTPHYHITAREIRVLTTSRQVTAKNLSFWVGRTKLFSLPSFTRSFNRTSESPIPLPAYSKDNFVQVHFTNSLIEEPRTLFNYDFTVSLKHTPSGTVIYERDLGNPTDQEPPPSSRKFTVTEPLRSALESSPALLRRATPELDLKRVSLYGLLTANTFVYNRRRTDLRVSRLPEVGISFRNILNRPARIDDPDFKFPRARSAFGTGFLSPANWFMNAEAALGYYQETPTHTQATRLAFRADATSPLFLVSSQLYVRYGGTLWANAYGNNNAYTLMSPEAEMSYFLGRGTLLGAAYRYSKDFGKTPFEFDRRDVTHELRLRYAYSGGSWAYDTEIKYDMERLRAYDSLFSIVRRLDCLEFGLAYRTRNQGISLIFNLLPGSFSGRGAPAAGTTGTGRRP